MLIPNCSFLSTNFKGIDRIFRDGPLGWAKYLCTFKVNALIDYLTAVLESINLQGIYLPHPQNSIAPTAHEHVDNPNSILNVRQFLHTCHLEAECLYKLCAKTSVIILFPVSLMFGWLVLCDYLIIEFSLVVRLQRLLYCSLARLTLASETTLIVTYIYPYFH